MKKPFSKKLLIVDYVIAVFFIIGYFLCVIVNGVYANQMLKDMVNLGYDVSSAVPPQLLNLDGFTTMLSVWLAQLGVSSAAYYIMVRSEHRLQISTNFVESLPQDIKDNVDMTSVLTTALSTSDN